MPRVGLSTESVVDVAAAVVDRDGLESLTLARVAAEVGVRAPSLYNHVAGLDDLRRSLGLRGLDVLGDACRTAVMGRVGSEALVAMMWAYRQVAADHPGLYRLTQVVAPAEDVEWKESSDAIVGAVLAVLAGYGLEGDDAIHAARTIRSAMHGFVLLESEQGFGLPQDLDDTFEFLVATIDRGLR